ncbi:MAG: acetyl-CoA decarbonylase/synthase complex subunit gamma [Firmicutes bacterium]|nr:acetyl-CoA decarbonylase/synthase complex subunit gamma [Bacillota bacterium]
MDIFKLMPKTNCKDCGSPSCLAFAMKVAAKKAEFTECPHLSEESSNKLNELMEPPIRKVVVQKAGRQVVLGDEKVLFRHDESFYNPTAIVIRMPDLAEGEEIKLWLSKLGEIVFERAGQKLQPDMAAFEENIGMSVEENSLIIDLIKKHSPVPIVLRIKRKETAEKAVASDIDGVIIYPDFEEAADFLSSCDNKTVVAVACKNIDHVKNTGKLFSDLKMKNGIFVLTADSLAEKLDILTTVRREALLSGERLFASPVMLWNEDPESEAAEASLGILKYGSVIVINSEKPEVLLSYLTLRQNIFTDPRRPIQVEAKLYKVGDASDDSPVLVTTNFSLTYFTVMQEIEASRIPAWLLIVDTDGTSVLTAWSADRFNAAKILKFLDDNKIREIVNHRNLIIPGYVSTLKEDIEEISDWNVIPGPREAVGIPQFLRNYNKASVK